MRKNVAKAVIEIGFIIFLFYSNLLMGEFTHSGEAHGHNFAWAVRDVVTPANLGIALIAGVVGYLLFEFLRRKL
jgi:hypothetical protein